jgi:phosphopantetheinyl transferase (holo-ACP synthase)
MTICEDNRALLRALRIERAIRKLCERHLRRLMTSREYDEFRSFCRAESLAGCEVQSLAKLTAEAGDA